MDDPILKRDVSLDDRLLALGTRQGRRDVLPIVAYVVALAADAKEIDVDDAAMCFERYYRGVNGPVKIDFQNSTIKVQVSKLRQIIKAKNPKLINRIMKLHDKARRAGERTIPLYAAMVEVCRRVNNGEADRRLTDEEIIAVFKPRRRRR